MQASFRQASLPLGWKLASVTPIFKKGNKLDCNNYRPISLVPIVSKVMEAIISDAMSEFLLQEAVIPAQQHGFIKSRSVVTNLLHCINDWSTSLNSRQPVDVVYLDFSKAFDRIPTRRLLTKLDHFGIRGRLNRWIQNFLSDRYFRVRVGEDYSSDRPVKSGVPQGSVLGPLLFVVYISDLQLNVSSTISIYADDTKLYVNPVTNQHTLQQDLNSVFEWSTDWLLPLNIEKCVVLHMGRNNPSLPYFIDSCPLKCVTSHCDLGVIVNSDLSWSDHTASVCRRANSKLFLIRKCFSHMSSQSASKLFATYVRPILEFAVSVWNPDLIRDKTSLESVQRRATRLPFGRVRPSYEERLSLAHLTTFEHRRLRGDLIMAFRILRYNYGNLNTIFTLNQDERLRGHHFKLKKEHGTARSRVNFLPNRIFDIWNNLDRDIVAAPSVSVFKKRLDNFFL